MCLRSGVNSVSIMVALFLRALLNDVLGFPFYGKRTNYGNSPGMISHLLTHLKVMCSDVVRRDEPLFPGISLHASIVQCQLKLPKGPQRRLRQRITAN